MRVDESGPSADELAAAADGFVDDAEPIARALAETAGELVYAGFSATRSPDGAAWRPLVRPRAGIGGALLLTGALRDEASRAVVAPDGFLLEVTGPKAVHQRGSRGRHLPARPFYPEPTRLPASWEAALEAAGDRALAKKVP
ncbi:MAG: hypothetical protein U0324_44155 [Polyangiales bacterium]